MTSRTERLDSRDIEDLFARWEKNGALESFSANGHTLKIINADRTETELGGEDLIDFLFYSRNHYAYQVRDARAALKRQGIDVPSLSLADAIYLLVGRYARR